MRALQRISGRLEALRGRRLLFVPVLLACGIGAYFALPREPGAPGWAALGLVAFGFGALGWRWRGQGLASLVAALALVAAGLLVAGLRTELMRAPVLGFRYYGPVEGRIVAVDRSASGRTRLTLDRLRLAGLAPEEVPARVRVSLPEGPGLFAPAPGQRVGLTAHLGPPDGPVEPGGFDFRRSAWFDRIGAVGYARGPALLLLPAGPDLVLSRLRAGLSAGLQAAMPGEAGAFAAAVTTGDRSAIGAETLTALRRANLAHLLAISGLHMGLVTGFVFAAVRLGLALIPGLALVWPLRKIAAVLALAAGAAYLALSGGNVATLRAFVMVAAMFVALLADRRALTLRSVALAALLILLAQPEALTEPGFQMSFAATTALVAGFGALRLWPQARPPGWAAPALALGFSSLVAGLATAPVAAAHFNQVSHYGLLANLLAMPAMGLLVMPLAVLAALLWPLGLAGPALWLMRWPILWILAVAGQVSQLGGAVGQVPAPPAPVLPLLALGGLTAVLLQGRTRALGLPLLLAGALIWSGVRRPDLLVAASGGLIGVVGPEGRALSKPAGDGFAAASWLENDGDPAAQDAAAARPGFSEVNGIRLVDLGPLRIAHLTGRGAAGRLDDACALAQVVVLSVPVQDRPAGCAIYDETALERSGALAFWLNGERVRMLSVAEVSGRRPWTGAAQ